MFYEHLLFYQYKQCSLRIFYSIHTSSCAILRHNTQNQALVRHADTQAFIYINIYIYMSSFVVIFKPNHCSKLFLLLSLVCFFCSVAAFSLSAVKPLIHYSFRWRGHVLKCLFRPKRLHCSRRISHSLRQGKATVCSSQ